MPRYLYACFEPGGLSGVARLGAESWSFVSASGLLARVRDYNHLLLLAGGELSSHAAQQLQAA